MKKRFLSFVILFLVFARVSWAEVKVTETVTYYEVYGKTADELRSDMRRQMGRDKGVAFTDWQVSCKVERVEMPQGFLATKPHTTLALVYHYPRWADEAQALAPLREKWAAFIRAVVFHEKVHGEIAREAAHAIDHAVMVLKPAPDTRTLDDAVKAAGERVLKVYRKRELEYDEATRNGQVQGTVF